MSRIIEAIGRPDGRRNKCISRNYLLLLLTLIVALALVVAIAGYILNGGNLQIAHKGLSVTYPNERSLFPPPSDHQSIFVAQPSPIDYGTLKCKVFGPIGLPAIGASVMAEKDLGVSLQS